MNNKEKHENKIYCFVLQLINSSEGPGMFFRQRLPEGFADVLRQPLLQVSDKYIHVQPWTFLPTITAKSLNPH